MRTLKISLLVFILSITIFSQNFWEALTPIPNSIFASLTIDSAGYIYAGTINKGLFVSSDNGFSWSDSIAICDFYVEAFEFNSNGDIFMGDHGCTFRSSDHGLTWELVQYTFNCHTILINQLNYIYIGAEQDYNVGRLWRSTDNGLSWEYYDLPNWAVVYSMDSDSSGNLYAGTTFGTFISTDMGDSWDNNQLVDKWIPSIIITRNNTALAGTWGEGIYRSTDLGSFWEQTSLTSLQIRDLIIDQNGYLWTATNDGVFKSIDDGANWLLVDNSGLTNLNIRTIAIDLDGYIIVGVDSGKIFRTVESTTSVSEIYKASDFSLSQNYPNPFNPVTKIKYGIPQNVRRETATVSLKIYDVLGREVAILVNEEKPAGEYEVEFNAANLPSGIYFYQLKAGQYSETKKMVLLR